MDKASHSNKEAHFGVKKQNFLKGTACVTLQKQEGKPEIVMCMYNSQRCMGECSASEIQMSLSKQRNDQVKMREAASDPITLSKSVDGGKVE